MKSGEEVLTLLQPTAARMARACCAAAAAGWNGSAPSSATRWAAAGGQECGQAGRQADSWWQLVAHPRCRRFCSMSLALQLPPNLQWCRHHAADLP
jgi:hypothetical protein